MPNVTIEWLPRTLEERRTVIKAVTDVLMDVGGVTRRDTISVNFIHADPEMGGFGGLLGCDREDFHR